jgi:hypothetical protein
LTGCVGISSASCQAVPELDDDHGLEGRPAARELGS